VASVTPRDSTSESAQKRRSQRKTCAQKDGPPLATPIEEMFSRAAPTVPPETRPIQLRKCPPSQSEVKRRTTSGQRAQYHAHGGEHEETAAPACPSLSVHERTSTPSLQPFYKKSRTLSVAEVFQIGHCGVVEANSELFYNSWSAGFLKERLYSEFSPLDWGCFSKALAALHAARVGRGGGGGGDSGRRPTRCVGHNDVNCALQHPGAIVPWQRGRREATERGGAPVG